MGLTRWSSRLRRAGDGHSLEYGSRSRALPCKSPARRGPIQPKVEIKKTGPRKKHTSKQQASIDKQASIGY